MINVSIDSRVGFRLGILFALSVSMKLLFVFTLCLNLILPIASMATTASMVNMGRPITNQMVSVNPDFPEVHLPFQDLGSKEEALLFASAPKELQESYRNYYVAREAILSDLKNEPDAVQPFFQKEKLKVRKALWAQLDAASESLQKQKLTPQWKSFLGREFYNRNMQYAHHLSEINNVDLLNGPLKAHLDSPHFAKIFAGATENNAFLTSSVLAEESSSILLGKVDPHAVQLKKLGLKYIPKDFVQLTKVDPVWGKKLDDFFKLHLEMQVKHLGYESLLNPNLAPGDAEVQLTKRLGKTVEELRNLGGMAESDWLKLQKAAQELVENSSQAGKERQKFIVEALMGNFEVFMDNLSLRRGHGEINVMKGIWPEASLLAERSLRYAPTSTRLLKLAGKMGVATGKVAIRLVKGLSVLALGVVAYQVLKANNPLLEARLQLEDNIGFGLVDTHKIQGLKRKYQQKAKSGSR